MAADKAISGAIVAALLQWYDRHARDLPWRISPAARRRGARPDPYRVWLSEIMLQQTRVETVDGYWRRFVARWPDLPALAAAPVEAVLQEWAGLGYYSRARNLAACASDVLSRHGGRFPADETALRALPGIGDYTAAAIAAIAFDLPAAAVDGNVARVIGRLAARDLTRTAARAAVAALVPGDRPGDFTQAMMDLGSSICTPRKPRCPQCPLAPACEARRMGREEDWPARKRKSKAPERRGSAFAAVRGSREVLLVRRPANGLLGGMNGLPTSGWSATSDGATGTGAAPFAGNWALAGEVRHAFTHFTLRLEVWRADFAKRPAAPAGGRWTGIAELGEAGLPTLMRKACDVAMAADPRPSPRSNA
jgi:A/G-specific adenine glycosylase